MPGVAGNSNPLVKKFSGLLGTLGKNIVHAIFPKDFEAYYVFFELVDSEGKTEAFITFPVQPEQISETQTRITNIKKTASGVVAISTESFVPIDIDLKGNFGTKFKFTVGNKFIDGGLIAFILKKDVEGYVSFSNAIKTGYGILKAIETMLETSEKLDEYSKPRKLYFYNTILGNNYQVKVKSWTHSQNTSQNMIPQYSLQMTAVSPIIQSLKERVKKLGKAMLVGALNKGIGKVAGSVKSKLK